MKRTLEDPELAVFTAVFAERLRHAIGERSLRSVASSVGISHTTLSRLLAAQATPTFAVLWALERHLDADLWPGRTGPKRPRRRRGS